MLFGRLLVFLSALRVYVLVANERAILSAISSSPDDGVLSTVAPYRRTLLAARRSTAGKYRWLLPTKSGSSRGVLRRLPTLHRRSVPTGRDLSVGSTSEAGFPFECPGRGSLATNLARSWQRHHQVRDETTESRSGLLEPIPQRGFKQQPPERASRREAPIRWLRDRESPQQFPLQKDGTSLRPGEKSESHQRCSELPELRQNAESEGLRRGKREERA